MGSNLQRDIFEVLLRFRRHPIALMADIEKMYRQIVVTKEHTNCQRILWRANPDENITTYNLKTITYETGCASYLAIRTLKQAALDGHTYSEVARGIVKNDFYVDDLISGADALLLHHELNSFLRDGGFHLRKWSTNDSALLFAISGDNSKPKPIAVDKTSAVRTFGVLWDTKLDVFLLDSSMFQYNENSKKCTILSAIA